MASPFRHFRKYTGLFMVVLTVMLMMAFVVADPLMQYLNAAGGGGGGGSRAAGDVVVSWDGGQLTEGQLAELRTNRQLLKTFHDAIIGFGNEAARADGSLEAQLSVAPLQLASSPQQGLEQDVVNTHILSGAAKQAGMAVSDQTVIDYLRALGRQKVDNDQLRFILGRMEQGARRRLSFEFMFDLVRDALLARNFRQSYTYALATVLPQQRYRDWLAVNDRVVVEAAAIKAEDYLAEVAEPTDVELEDFFNEYKDRQALPDFVGRIELPSPNPGFTQPRTVSLQYLRADYQKALDAEIEKVTDEEIAEYYETNKAQFIQADDLLSGDSLGEDLFDSEDKAEQEEPAETPDEKSDSEKTAAGEAEETGAESDSGEEASEKEDAVEESSTEEPAVEETAPAKETPTEEPAAEEAPTEEPAGEESGEETSSNVRRDSPFRFVVLQETDEQEPGDENRSEEDEDRYSDTDRAETKVNYQPLEEVSDTIRRRLAEERAAKRVRDLMDEIQADLRKEYNKYFTEVVVNTPEGESPEPPPATLTNLQPYAEKHGLELEKIEKTTNLAFRDTELGKTFGVDGKAANKLLGQVLFFDDAQDIGDFEPFSVVSGSTFDRYVVQRLETELPKVPEFDEVKTDVIAAWKRRKAGELALAAAKKKAEEAKSNGGTLTDLFSGDKKIEVTETEPFGRLIPGSPDPRTRQAPLTISQPEGIVAAGPDFLEAVFEADGVTAVLNHDHSIAYVVRIARHMESPAELQQGYLGEGGFWYGQQAMDNAHGAELGSAFVRDLVGEEGLDWKRTPDAP